MPDPMQMLADGIPYRDVAKATGMNVSTLHRDFQATGRKRKRRPRKQMKAKTLEAARLVEGGMTYRAACKQTGASQSSVCRAVQAGFGRDA